MTDTADAPKGEKIAKILAHAGVASRRQAEEMVRAGRVTIGGKKITDPAERAGKRAEITVDGKPIERQTEILLWRYHKPVGEVVTHKDPEGRKTVFEALPRDMGRVISVGRLDLTSEGLLLLTNDGELARWLELPATGWKRKYRVRAFGHPPADLADQLARGITIEGIRYAPMDVTVDRGTGPNIWLTIGLREGKNREVRRVLEHFGLTVNRLLRLGYGPFQLGDLAKGAVAQVPRRILMDQCQPFFREKGIEMPKGDGRAKAKEKPKPRPGAKPKPKADGGKPQGRKPGTRPQGRDNARRRRPA